jgi:hypothetical protein
VPGAHVGSRTPAWPPDDASARRHQSRHRAHGSVDHVDGYAEQLGAIAGNGSGRRISPGHDQPRTGDTTNGVGDVKTVF